MRSGFTLVETLVVVAITVFLSGILLTYNRSTDNQVVLAAEQARVAGILFRAKSFALQKNVKGSEEACGFGVHFVKPGTVTLFGDRPAAGDCAASNEVWDAGEEVEELALNPRVAIDSYNGDTGVNAFDVFMRSPYLETSGAGIITLKLVATGDTLDVVVGEGGSVSASQ